MVGSGTRSGAAASMGIVRGFEGGIGLAMVKLTDAIAAEDGRVKLVGGDDVIEVFRPQWWSQEWGREEEGGS